MVAWMHGRMDAWTDNFDRQVLKGHFIDLIGFNPMVAWTHGHMDAWTQSFDRKVL